MTHCKKCKSPSDTEFCDECYYPGIGEDYQEYIQLINEGHRRVDAAFLSGWYGAEEV